MTEVNAATSYQRGHWYCLPGCLPSMHAIEESVCHVSMSILTLVCLHSHCIPIPFSILTVREEGYISYTININPFGDFQTPYPGSCMKKQFLIRQQGRKVYHEACGQRKRAVEILGCYYQSIVMHSEGLSFLAIGPSTTEVKPFCCGNRMLGGNRHSPQDSFFLLDNMPHSLHSTIHAVCDLCLQARGCG